MTAPLASAFAGTGALVRLILRRDRWRLLLWIVPAIAIAAGGMAAAGTLYPTPEARLERFEQIQNVPMFMVFQSVPFDSGAGALAVQQSFAGATLIGAFGAVLLMVRHTRSDEQAGRRELLGSAVIGRHAPLAAATLVIFSAGMVIAAVNIVAMIGAGLAAPGSVLFGLVTGLAVWLGAALAAVAAQISSSPRAAAIGAFAAFYGFHFVRGIGDLLADRMPWLAWTVPNGWLEQVRPFAGNRGFVLLLPLAFTFVLLYAAITLADRRDLASGILPARLGPARGARSLQGPLALTWRAHRTVLAVAVAATFGMSLVVGLAGGGDIMREYAQGRWVRELSAALGISNPADALFVYVAFSFVFPIAIYGIASVRRLCVEESNGGAEMLLATPVSRTRWALAHLCFAFGVPTTLLVVLGVGFGVGLGVSNGDMPGELGRMLATTVPLVPAVWFIVGVTTAAYGLLGPRGAVVGWFVLAIGIAGEILVKVGMPEWVFLATSPFAHVNPYFAPGRMTFVVLAALALVLTVAGVDALRRRDLEPG